jgi:adenylylsulfate kinase
MSKIIWIFGPSGSGKTTLASRLTVDLPGALLVDADHMRKAWGIKPDFTREGRLKFQEQLRDAVRTYANGHGPTIVASITPYQELRNKNRECFKDYFDVYLTCDLDILVKRDPKGLYKRALSGEVYNFFAHFECPIGLQCDLPKLVIETGRCSVEESYAVLKDAVKRL